MSDDKEMTVGRLREIIAGLPDDTPIYPDWAIGPPGDSDPAVEVNGFRVKNRRGKPYLSVLVDIVHLDDIEGEEEDEEDDDDDA